MMNFVYQRICNKDLIFCKPDELLDHANSFNNQFANDIAAYAKSKRPSQTTYGKFKSTMESFYKKFFSAECKQGGASGSSSKGFLNGHWFTHTLDITTCPYCNRSYTFTIGEKDIKVRPQLDHFYPKSEYPYLALSFYNLVPVCPICNLLKGEKLISFNPYKRSFGEKHKFIIQSSTQDLSWITDKSQIVIDIKSDPQEENKNIEVLGLKKLYNGHVDYVKEILDKASAYNASYYDAMINSFQGLGKTEEEIDRIVWGNYIETANHNQRPLSKLTRDILDQLKIK